MRSSIFAGVLAAAAAAPQVLATLYITAPVASTSCGAGQPCTVSWNDDGTTPSLATIGACTVGLYVGSQQTQIMLQSLGDVDVSTQSTASFTPDATVGGNSDLYFLRFTSVNYMDGQYNWMGFSAKFTLTGMTGTFNATEQSLMTAPTSAIGGSSTVPATTTASGGSSAATTTGVATVTTAKSGSSTGTSAKTSGTSSPATSSGAASPAALVMNGAAITGVAAVVLSSVLGAFAL